MSAEYTHQVADFAHSRGLKLHIDGARLFNAAVALGIPAKELSGPADSVTFCLSKALCAPVGSIITGSKDFIARAHRIRKMLGGGMRQAGVLAAAGIVALETMIDRLAEDHARARRLAADMKNLPGLVLDPGSPQTNMIFCSLAPELPLSASQVAARMQEQCVKIGIAGSRRFRLVLHYWIDDAAVEKAVEAFKSALAV